MIDQEVATDAAMLQSNPTNGDVDNGKNAAKTNIEHIMDVMNTTYDIHQGPEEAQPQPSPTTLSHPVDLNYLSVRTCWQREYCVEIFPATEEGPRKGRKGKPIVLNQIGLRCAVCKKFERFPTTLGRVKSNFDDIVRHYFAEESKGGHGRNEEYEGLSTKKAKRGRSVGEDVSVAKYWVESAKEVDLIEVDGRIMFDVSQLEERSADVDGVASTAGSGETASNDGVSSDVDMLGGDVREGQSPSKMAGVDADDGNARCYDATEKYNGSDDSDQDDKSTASQQGDWFEDEQAEGMLKSPPEMMSLATKEDGEPAIYNSEEEQMNPFYDNGVNLDDFGLKSLDTQDDDMLDSINPASDHKAVISQDTGYEEVSLSEMVDNNTFGNDSNLSSKNSQEEDGLESIDTASHRMSVTSQVTQREEAQSKAKVLWKGLWFQLVDRGWTSRVLAGSTNWIFLRPCVSKMNLSAVLRNGRDGTDYFLSANGVVRYATGHLGWTADEALEWSIPPRRKKRALTTESLAEMSAIDKDDQDSLQPPASKKPRTGTSAKFLANAAKKDEDRVGATITLAPCSNGKSLAPSPTMFSPCMVVKGNDKIEASFAAAPKCEVTTVPARTSNENSTHLTHHPQAKSPNMPWNQLWIQMRGSGWSFCHANDLSASYWIRPKVAKMTRTDMLSQCTDGIHYFSTKDAVHEYAVRHLAWVGEVAVESSSIPLNVPTISRVKKRKQVNAALKSDGASLSPKTTSDEQAVIILKQTSNSSSLSRAKKNKAKESRSSPRKKNNKTRKSLPPKINKATKSPISKSDGPKPSNDGSVNSTSSSKTDFKPPLDQQPTLRYTPSTMPSDVSTTSGVKKRKQVNAALKSDGASLSPKTTCDEQAVIIPKQALKKSEKEKNKAKKSELPISKSDGSRPNSGHSVNSKSSSEQDFRPPPDQQLTLRNKLQCCQFVCHPSFKMHQLSKSSTESALSSNEDAIRDFMKKSILTGKTVDGIVVLSPGFMYIYGGPGTGKTAAVASCARERKLWAKSNGYKDTHFCNINVPSSQTLTSILKKIATSIGIDKNTEPQTFEKQLKKKVVVLILDEIDMLFKQKKGIGETCFKQLICWAENRNMRFSMIGISNCVNDANATCVRELGNAPRELVFSAYSEKDILAILEQRLGKAVDRKALQLISRRVARISGDARCALEITSNAAGKCSDLLSDEELDKVLKFDDEYMSPVKLPHMMRAIKEGMPMMHVDIISGLPRAAKVVLCILISLSQVWGPTAKIGISTLKKYCIEASHHSLMDEVGFGHLNNLVGMLIDSGLLLTGNAGGFNLHDVNPKLKLDVQLDDVDIALEESLLKKGGFYQGLVDYVKREHPRPPM